MPSQPIDYNPIEIRSEEVQEIISHVPNWIIRWGITMIFVVFLIFLTVSWFVKYPDVLKAKVMITSNPAPIEIVARADGPLALLKEDGATVLPGEPLAYIMSEVSYEDVLLTEQLLVKIVSSSFSEEDLMNFSRKSGLRLGGLATYETALRRDAEAWLSFGSQQSHAKQIAQLKKQQESLQLMAQNQEQQLVIYGSEILLAKQKFMADSMLHAQKVTAPFEFAEQKATYMRELRAFKNAEAALLNNRLQDDQLQGQIVQLESTEFEEEMRLKTALKGSHHELTEQINRWKQQYLLRSSIAGKVAYLEILQDGKMVATGSKLFTVLPDTDEIFAYAELPLAGSGKVKEGQNVNIRLESYPHEQYGMLTGRIVELSPIPNEQGYILKLELPNGLRSTYNKQLTFRHNLTGETEVITEDLRLLERVFYGAKLILDRKDAGLL